jgi:hypothetical protein
LAAGVAAGMRMGYESSNSAFYTCTSVCGLLLTCRMGYKYEMGHYLGRFNLFSDQAKMDEFHRISIVSGRIPDPWWQPPRVIRIPQLKQTLSTTRCNHSSKCTWNHSISLWISNQAREISGRCSAQKDVKMIKK